jgi:acyl dehydratase
MRVMVDYWAGHKMASLGSPGIDELRWMKPVYPGDVIHVTQELLEKRRSASRRDMGLTKTRWTITNQDDDTVMTMVANGLIKVRDPETD